MRFHPPLGAKVKKAKEPLWIGKIPWNPEREEYKPRNNYRKGREIFPSSQPNKANQPNK